ncbi:MAG: dihydroneopterin aldolase [Thermomicrobiales bacterium]
MLTDGRKGRDQILLEGLQFYGYHGVNAEERVLGQRFQVDVTLDFDLSAAASSDDIADTVSYSAVFKVVRVVVEGEPRNLLEAVAGAICTSIFAEFPPVDRIAVVVRKPHPPMRGAVLSAVGVRLERDRAEGG